MWRSLVLWLGVVGGVWGQASYTLPFRPLDAEYSVPLNRIVMISSSPNQLQIYDPATQVNVAVSLPAPPLDLALSPSGLYAAVGHSGAVSYVNLFSGVVERSYTVPGQAQSLVVGATFLYVELVQEGSRQLRSVDLLTGTVITSTTRGDSLLGARVHPRGDAIYTMGGFFSSGRLEKLTLRDGLLVDGQTAIGFRSRPEICGSNWVSTDGESIFNGCGSVFWSSVSPSLELQYRGSFSDLTRIRSLWELSGRNELAVIPGQFTQSSTPGRQDTEVQFYTKGSLRLAGRLALPTTVANGVSHPTRGRWVFGDGGSELYVIAQADTAAGLVQDYTLRVFDLNNTAGCAPALSATTVSAPGEGALLTVNVTGAANCLYRLSSPVSWLQAAGATLRSGEGALEFVVRPNLGAARIGTLAIGGQTLTVNQAAKPAPLPNPLPLSFRLRAADYSKSLDRLVMASDDVTELSITNPQTNEERVVPLRFKGISVVVDPTGNVAAVGHDGWVSLVDLVTGAVTREYPVVTDANWIVWGGNGFLYLFSQRSGQSVVNLRLADGSWTLVENTSEVRHGRLQPGSSTVYIGVQRWSTGNGALAFESQSQSAGVNCPELFWFYERGDRMLTTCSEVRRVTGNPADDLNSGGVFSPNTRLRWAEHSHLRRSVAVVGAVDSSFSSTISDEVRLYGDEQSTLAGRRAFATGVRGRYVFWNQGGSAVYALGSPETNAGVQSPAQVLVIAADAAAPGCTPTFTNATATVGITESVNAAAVAVGGNCAWTATTNATWVRILSGSFGLGPSSLSYAVEANRLAVARVATIVLNGGATFTVTQNAAPVAVEPVTVTIPASGGARSFAVTTAISATAWTATATVPWVTFPSGATGTGNGTVSYTVAPNTGSARSALIRVNSANFSILQEAGSNTGIPNGIPAFVSTRDLGAGRREFIFRDSNGATDLGVLNILINRSLDGRAACYVAYNAATEQFFLVDNAGTGLLELPATPSTAAVENSQCKIERSSVAVVRSVDRLTLTLTIQLGLAFRGPLAVYAAARDRAEANSGWQSAAVIQTNLATGILAAGPNVPFDISLSTGQTVSYAVRYSTTDLSGPGAITTMQVLINSALDAANACYVGIDRAAQRAYLVSDDGLQLMGSGVPLDGSPTANVTSENSRCVLRSAGSSLVTIPFSSDLILTLSLQFKSGFAGNRFAYGGAQAAGAGRNSGWSLLQAVKLE
jgi:hypothetical protein